MVNKVEFYSSFFKGLTLEEGLVTLMLAMEELYIKNGLTNDEFEMQLSIAKSQVLEWKDKN